MNGKLGKKKNKNLGFDDLKHLFGTDFFRHSGIYEGAWPFKGNLKSSRREIVDV